MRRYISIFCLLLLSSPALSQTVGAPIDNFSLRSLEGQTHRASDSQGKVLVLAIIGYN